MGVKLGLFTVRQERRPRVFGNRVPRGRYLDLRGKIMGGKGGGGLRRFAA